MTAVTQTAHAPIAPLPGLDPDDAGARLERDGPNELPTPPSEPLIARVARQGRDPMALLLLAAAIVEGAGLREWMSAAAILAIVVANATIALVQEGRAKTALDSLRKLETPTARVRRGGRLLEIPTREIVAGDLVLVEAGDRVPADVRLLHSASVETDESILTGESMPATKDAGAVEDESAALGDRPWMLFSGTLVTRGTADGRVSATGPGTVMGTLAMSLTDRRPPTPLQLELRHLSVVLGTAAVVIAGAVSGMIVARNGVSAASVEEAFLAGVALAVAAVPEGLATVTIVGLALGVRRMARQGAIVRTLLAVETLGSTTALALDKTGTLTENRMHLEAVITADGEIQTVGTLHSGIGQAFARVAALCSEAGVDPPSGDPVERALLEAVGAARVTRLRELHPRHGVVPFDAQRRRMTVTHDIDDASMLLVKGAPEVVVARCTAGLVPDGEQALDAADRHRIIDAVETFAGRGFRMLALAQRPEASIGDAPEDVDAHDRDLTLVGVAVLRDPVRPEAAASVREAAEAGVRLLMVTGDHPGTALAVASEVGLAPPGTKAITGAQIRERGLPDDPLAHPVYARVDPDQKLALVTLLRERGQVVGMTGDGVNDAPSLRAADIGVALGASGNQVAREAADMVITDDNLATIVGAVREGRGVYDNVRKVVDYLIAGNLSEISVVVVALLLFPDLGVPLLPLQLLWINLLTDGLPAVALGMDPIDPSLMRTAPRLAGSRILGPARLLVLAGRGAVIAGAALTALAICRFAWHVPWPEARTAMFTTLVAAHLTYAFSVRRPLGSRRPGILTNRWLLGAVAFALILQAVVVSWSPLQEVFATERLGAHQWALVAGLGVAAPIIIALMSGRTHRQTVA